MATLEQIMNETPIMPQSPEAEKVVLGTLLSESNTLNDVREMLPVDAFYVTKHRDIYQAILNVADRGEHADIITVFNECQKQKYDATAFDLAQLSSNYTPFVNEPVAIINEKYKRRKFFEIGAYLQANAHTELNDINDVLADVKDKLDGIFVTNQDNVYTMKDAVEAVYENIKKNFKSLGELTGFATGFKKLDKRSGGLQTSDLIIVAADTSMGKALPMDAKILLANGEWISNKDVTIGTKVASVDGEESYVTGVFPQGIKPMYKIKFSDGREVVACEDHLWEIESCSFKSGSRILTSKEIFQYQNQSVAYKNRMRTPYFSGCFGVYNDFIIHPYVLGVLLGDGCLSRHATFCNPDEFVVNKVKSLIPECCDVHQINSTNPRTPSYGIVTPRGKSNPVLDALKNIGLSNTKSGGKFIPKEYLTACREQRLHLLQGIMDTDGYASKGNNSIFTSKSEQLANDVRYLAHSLGYRATIYKKKAKYNGCDYGFSYNVVISGVNKFQIFTLPRKKDRVKEPQRPYNCIVDVEHVGEMECQCISVSHPRALYVTDNFIVTHNTSLAIKIAMNCGCPIAFYSMEMKKEQIAARMISIASGVPSNEILFSKLDSGQILQIDKGVSQVEHYEVYFDDRSTSNIETILSSIRMMKIKYGVKGVIVDYLQILNVNMKGTNKEQQMGDVARRLKNIAKELDIWVIALSQLSRDNMNPQPSLSRLRDSGQIAEAADMVILIYRPEVYGKTYPDDFSTYDTKGTAMIDVAKGRNVGLMKFIVGFKKENTNFYDLDEVPIYNANKDRPDALPF